MWLINIIKVKALLSGLQNISDEKLADIIIDYQRKEFGNEVNKAISATADKLLRVGLALYKKHPVDIKEKQNGN